MPSRVDIVGNMMLKAYMLSEGRIEVYLPLNNKDLSEIRDLIHVMKQLNAFMHSHSSETLRSTFPVVRLRSSSVVSSPSNYTSGSEHGYSLRSCGGESI